jgi:hypothetical protein
VLPLSTCTEDVFEMVIAYMWTGLVKNPEGHDPPNDAFLALAVEYLVFADYIDLQGPSSDFLYRFDGGLNLTLGLTGSKSKSYLTSEHIQAAERLPPGHPLRMMFAESCLGPCQLSVHRTKGRNNRKRFKFWKEMEELDGFSIHQASVLIFLRNT